MVGYYCESCGKEGLGVLTLEDGETRLCIGCFQGIDLRNMRKALVMRILEGYICELCGKEATVRLEDGETMLCRECYGKDAEILDFTCLKCGREMFFTSHTGREVQRELWTCAHCQAPYDLACYCYC